jgi:hypothetical protein
MWLSTPRERRLDNLEDFVRMEIAAAPKRKIRAIPLLVSGALMPQSGIVHKIGVLGASAVELAK